METDEQPLRVSLQPFEGPLDLLIHLIKKDDLDIHAIPVSEILNQYLEYLRVARELNIDLAGEFLEMAAELAYIKSKMLLPEPPEEKEEPDPRADLAQKLLEYQRYKRAAEWLLKRPLLGRDTFRPEPSLPPGEEEMIEVDLPTLLSTFQGLLKRFPREQHEVRGNPLGIAERVMELIERLRGSPPLIFESLFETDRTRSDVVLTLLAILEMAKQKLIKIAQTELGGSIVVCPLFQTLSEESEEI